LIGKNNQPGTLWLDAGCGSGLLASAIREKKVLLSLFHMDLAFEPLMELQTAKPSAVQSDVEMMPYKSSVFGGIVSASVFQWLDNTEKAVQEMYRVLAPGGVFVFSVFLENAFSQLITLRRKRSMNIPVRLFGLEEFTGLVEANGFKDIKSETIREEYYFPTGRDAIKYINLAGSTAVSGKRLGRKDLLALYDEYEKTFLTRVGVPVTIYAAVGTARKGK
jgi:malonyl-CoA O-methyltransferase